MLFVDDYLNVLTTGTSMKPVTDRYRVPRTQLGAIMKMTAAPIAVLVPVSTWALFFSGLFEAQGVTVWWHGVRRLPAGDPVHLLRVGGTRRRPC